MNKGKKIFWIGIPILTLIVALYFLDVQNFILYTFESKDVIKEEIRLEDVVGFGDAKNHIRQVLDDIKNVDKFTQRGVILPKVVNLNECNYAEDFVAYCYEEAKNILLVNRAKLEILAEELLEREVIYGDEIEQILLKAENANK